MKWAWAVIILSGIAVVALGRDAELPAQLSAARGSQTATVYESSGCHPSYEGACVSITSDVDCAGGSGNGPAYVGRVQVVGPDEYGLDRDGDGNGCE